MKKLSKIKNAYLVLVLICVGFALYAPTVFHGFVWDDHALIDENPAMKQISSIKGFFVQDLWLNSNQNVKSGFYRPLTLLVHFLNFNVFGGQPYGHHLFNLLFHSLNGVLIFVLLGRLTKDQFISFLAALFFVIHPVQVETVAFISDVSDILCVTFLLLSLYYYVNVRGNNRRFDGWLCCGFLFCAFLSKENAMIGGGLMLLVEIFFFSDRSIKQLIKNIRHLLPAAFLTLIFICIRVLVLGADNAVTTLGNARYVSILPSFDLWTHLLTIISIISLYCEMFFLPVNQTISYIVLPTISVFDPLSGIALFSFALILFLIIVTFNSDYKLISFSLLWFLITILPVSNLIPISNTIAERFMYLPSIGFCLLIALGISRFSLRKPVIMAVITTVIVGSLAFKSYLYSKEWENDFTLFSNVTNVTYHCSPIAHANLRSYYNRINKPAYAYRHDQASRRCVESIQSDYRKLKSEYLR